MSYGATTLYEQPAYLRQRMVAIKRYCDEMGVELVPSVGNISGGTASSGDPSHFEAFPVTADYVASGGKATIVLEQPDFGNTSFEELKYYQGRVSGFVGWNPDEFGTTSSLGTDVRFFRTAILDEVYKPYVLTARAKGLSGWTIMTRHVLRNALIPIVTYVSLSIPYLFTGSLLLESFFGIPGLGSVSINAIHSADMAVVRAIVVLGALLYQFVNLITDVLYAFLDPRIRMNK